MKLLNLNELHKRVIGWDEVTAVADAVNNSRAGQATETSIDLYLPGTTGIGKTELPNNC